MKSGKVIELSIGEARELVLERLVDQHKDLNRLVNLVNIGFKGVESWTENQVIQFFGDNSLCEAVEGFTKGTLVVIRSKTSSHDAAFDLVDVSSTVEDLQ